jgi:hypothetical protein
MFVWSMGRFGTTLLRLVSLAGLAVVVGAATAASAVDPGPWLRHTIDASSRGADGARLADIDRDGLPDVVTGWEEAGLVRVYRHPGAGDVRSPWPSEEAGPARSVEDAVPVDLDGDGRAEVVSACEGDRRALQVHRVSGPAGGPGREWDSAVVPGSDGLMQWMFVVPSDIDKRGSIDLAAGGKGAAAAIGWWESPGDPSDLAAWTWHRLRGCGWLMSLLAVDMDGDGDPDLLASDRKGAASGCFWLENPGALAARGAWTEHAVGAAGEEAMFLDSGDLDGDGLADVAAAVKPSKVAVFLRRDRGGTAWEPLAVPLPDVAGRAKAVSIGDIDLDGHADLVVTCEGAVPPKRGVLWLAGAPGLGGRWAAHDISGPDGVKFDLVPLVDLDRDGDLDVITTEESTGLGVVWYENPVVP